MAELKPCSICGAEAELLKDGEYYAVKCSNAACANSGYRTYDNALAALKGWNAENEVNDGDQED